MHLVDTELRCYECRKVIDFEEVEIVERDGKKFWVCPKCDMEHPIVDKITPKFGDEKKQFFRRLKKEN